MSLWDKKDSLYIEANTVNVFNFHFYHYYPVYSEFSQTSPSGYEIYFIDDTDKNNIKFNYTIKDASWYRYIAEEMDEQIFRTFDNYIDYDNDKDDPEDGETFTFNELRSVLVASNGVGEQSALLFQIRSTNGDENVSPQFGFINTIGYGSYCYTEGIKNISWVLMNLVYQKDSNSYTFTLDLYDTVEKKWRRQKNTLNDSYSCLVMPNNYNPQALSKHFPKFLIFMEGKEDFEFRNFFGYSVNISKLEAEEIIKGKIFYSKENTSIYAPLYNECTSLYSNTAFVNDGTVLPKGELIEGEITNQICKNGDIKAQEFIEF